jgi:hypothetical protein
MIFFGSGIQLHLGAMNFDFSLFTSKNTMDVTLLLLRALAFKE